MGARHDLTQNRVQSAKAGEGSGEGLEGDCREGICDTGQGLNMAGHKVTDIHVVRQIAFHQEIELAGCRIHFRDLIDIQCGFISHIIGFSQFTFNLNEDRLHDAPVSVFCGRRRF